MSRGDWSDTGPNSRPEIETRSSQEVYIPLLFFWYCRISRIHLPFPSQTSPSLSYPFSFLPFHYLLFLPSLLSRSTLIFCFFFTLPSFLLLHFYFSSPPYTKVTLSSSSLLTLRSINFFIPFVFYFPLPLSPFFSFPIFLLIYKIKLFNHIHNIYVSYSWPNSWTEPYSPLTEPLSFLPEPYSSLTEPYSSLI